MSIIRADPTLRDWRRYPYRHEITTRFADVDPQQHINNVSMAAMFEDARFRFDHSIGYRKAMTEVRTMIGANHIDYLGQAYYPDPLVVYVGVYEVGRTSWTLACLATQDDRVCAFARAVLVCTDGERPVPVPQSFRDALGANGLKPAGEV